MEHENNKRPDMQIDEGSIEAILAELQFPGEDAKAALAYLKSVGFTESVMEQIQGAEMINRKAAVWVAFALFNILLLALFGVGGEFTPFVPGVPGPLNNFIFLFLGMTFLGSVIGIVLSLDTTWFNRLIHKT